MMPQPRSKAGAAWKARGNLHWNAPRDPAACDDPYPTQVELRLYQYIEKPKLLGGQGGTHMMKPTPIICWDKPTIKPRILGWAHSDW